MIRLELLSKDNLESVWKLEKICFDDPWTLGMFESEIDNDISVFMVAVDEESEKVVAYAGVWLTLDFGDITNIAVHPDYRREGLGSRLLSTIIDLCKERDIERVCLEVKETNLSAIEFYKKSGFIQDGVRKKYYQNTYDAYLMSLDLKKE